MNIRFDDRGLVPAVVQDPKTRKVLMLGYMNRDAISATTETGFVHFWSRSRQTLWRKGETSGKTLRFRDSLPDCDADALLVLADPTGPTCHRGTPTCFDDGDLGQGFAAMEGLWTTIIDRVERRPEGSYTATLVGAGPDPTGRKVVEEATEVLMAAKDHATGAADDIRVAEEAADLMYHLLVLLAERKINPSLVFDVLAKRSR